MPEEIENGYSGKGNAQESPVPDTVIDQDLAYLEEQVEEENEGLNTRPLLKIILFVAVAAIIVIIIIGVFGFLAQSEYGP